MAVVPKNAYEAATKWRERIHSHPELGFAEHETAAAIAGYLRELGWQVETGVGGTGVVAKLPGLKSAPRLMLRTEMDALAIQDETGLPFASQVAGVSHACGHDAHMAMLLGVAAAISGSGLPHGDLGLAFQPAEELLGGGERMVADRLWERFDPDCCLAIHGMPALPAGVFGLAPGPVMAAIDNVRIRVIGKPGHGAMPHTTIDPIVAAAELLLSLQTIISRNLDPLAPAVITFGQIQGGTAINQVAPEVSLAGTIRYFDRGIGDKMADLIKQRCEGVALAQGAKIEVDLGAGYPETVNDDKVIAWLESLLDQQLGADSWQRIKPSTGSEDFSYFLRERPGAMIFLGTGGAYPLHHPSYQFPAEVIERGIALYLAAIEAVAGAPNPPWR